MIDPWEPVHLGGGHNLALRARAVRCYPEELAMEDANSKRRGWSWWYLLFIIQCVVALWVPLYNKAEPTWLGMPFFYWFQLLWVLVGAALTAIVYFATED